MPQHAQIHLAHYRCQINVVFSPFHLCIWVVSLGLGARNMLRLKQGTIP